MPGSASFRTRGRSRTTWKASRSPPRTTRDASSIGSFAAIPLHAPRSGELKKRVKLVDAVLESSKALRQRLGKSDSEKMDQYMTSLNEIEDRLVTSEKWIDIPLKRQDYGHLNLDVTTEGDPREYYRNMFDLIALAFDADITRSVTSC